MNDFLEISKYTLPSLIVFLAAYTMIKLFLKNEDKKRSFEFSMNQKDSVMPLRLQAYERLILLLERISPDSIVMRMNSTTLNAAQMKRQDEYRFHLHYPNSLSVTMFWYQIVLLS